jgi:hypothetical protein
MFSTAVLRPGLLALAVVGLASMEVSCGRGCPIKDQADVLDMRDGLYLVYRVTGFQDKVEFFELYRSKPEFDSCGMPRTPAVASAFYVREEGLLKRVEMHDNQLEIIYTRDASESIEPRKARLSQ